MLEDFKQHPVVAPLIADGKMVEYSAHVVPEAGLRMQHELVRDGVLIAGDAAGMCMNLGFTIRGMDLAMASGKLLQKRCFQQWQKMILVNKLLMSISTI